MTKIALFGTSADPPTAGHQAILQWLCAHYDQVAVWASDNPFKDHQTSLEHRLEMLRLLISEINPPVNNIGVYEQLSHRRSLHSVEKAKEIWGETADYYLVIGSDLAGQIRRWYRVQDLFEQVKILIVPRPGYLIDQKDLDALQDLGGEYEIADLTVPGVSSSAYREKKDKTVVTQPIKEYIHQEKLYA
ncbi:nicotinate (nicotinamide) nucleotide adenylyltransferase [Gloeothece citriformis PCC 7424]|uniref:nicotinate-nucleotide adenylyltransferase n=1 Tax=Gloeothece citriformis (strain PCC 7424) TaxID=65393 RepID=B7KAT8_GLOC7|nr:nicotinate-nucleotide adenylyltransferase [Gloeothece citriformis]ACK68760.1 nicotinate (nicotinamide) nucleotide adenylyltransferase [Gloeothece citriformis PCC 7424]